MIGQFIVYVKKKDLNKGQSNSKNWLTVRKILIPVLIIGPPLVQRYLFSCCKQTNEICLAKTLLKDLRSVKVPFESALPKTFLLSITYFMSQFYYLFNYLNETWLGVALFEWTSTAMKGSQWIFLAVVYWLPSCQSCLTLLWKLGFLILASGTLMMEFLKNLLLWYVWSKTGPIQIWALSDHFCVF